MASSMFGCDVEETVSNQDEDNEAEPQTPYSDIEVCLEEGKKEPVRCKCVLIGVGREAEGFIETALIHGSTETSKLGTLTAKSNRDSTSDSYLYDSGRKGCSAQTCQVFIHNKDVLLVTSKKLLQPDVVNKFTDRLFQMLDKATLEQVVVLSSAPACELIGLDSATQLPLLKHLKTNKFKHKPLGGVLEQPNTVRGFPAAVMTHCTVYGIAAVFYQLYIESIHLESHNMSRFLSVVEATPLKAVVKVTGNHKKLMTSLVDRSAGQHSLYM